MAEIETTSTQNKSIPMRMFGSTFLWMIVLVAVFDVAFNWWQPIQSVKNERLMPLSQNPVVSKIPKFLYSSSNPDIWVMGSSLPMMAIATWDEKYSGTIDCSDLKKVRTYTKALYLNERLNKKVKKHVTVGNLTCVACMASDVRMILEKSDYLGKAPKVVVYGVAPRSFVDNILHKSGKTAVEQVIAKFRSFEDIYKKQLPPDEVRDIIFSSVWNFYRTKADYRDFLIALACHKLSRSPTVYAAQQRAAARKAAREAEEEAKQKNLAKALTCSTSEIEEEKIQQKQVQDKPVNTKLASDLALYDMRYNPPNFAMFDKQKKEFTELLKFCKKKDITILVVGMPITKENKELLDPRLLARYRQELPVLTESYGGQFLNLDDNTVFLSDDFEDSVHTNAKGGKKVLDRLVENISLEKLM